MSTAPQSAMRCNAAVAQWRLYMCEGRSYRWKRGVLLYGRRDHHKTSDSAELKPTSAVLEICAAAQTLILASERGNGDRNQVGKVMRVGFSFVQCTAAATTREGVIFSAAPDA